MEQWLAWLNDYPLLLAAFIIVARIADVSLGTMRTLFVVRGHRGIAAALGLGEVIIWVLAVSGVLSDLTVMKLLAYGIGYAAGNFVGIAIEQKLAVGHQVVTMISRYRARAVAAALRLADYMVTEIPATGGRGQVAMCIAVVPRRRTARVCHIARSIDENVFLSVEDVRDTSLIRRPTEATGVPMTGWRAVLKKK